MKRVDAFVRGSLKMVNVRRGEDFASFNEFSGNTNGKSSLGELLRVERVYSEFSESLKW